MDRDYGCGEVGGWASASDTRVPGTIGTGSPSASSRAEAGGCGVSEEEHGVDQSFETERPAHLVEGLTDLVPCLVEGLRTASSPHRGHARLARLARLVTGRGSEPPRRVAVMRETLR